MTENEVKVWAVLPEEIAKALDEWADEERRSRANMTTLIIEKAVIDRKNKKTELLQQLNRKAA